MAETILNTFEIWTTAWAQKTNGRGIKADNQSLLGVQKLRELILELAVRGKLVPQDPDDEPASILLEKIAEEKKRLISEGKIKSNKPLMTVNEVEKPFKIPSTWRWVYLSVIGQIIGGGTPSSNEIEYWAENEIRWLTPADLYGLKTKIITKGKRDISIKGLNNSSATLLPMGAVLFSSRAPIGYVAIAGNELATNQGFKSCVPYLSGMSEFIYYFLKRSAKEIDNAASGTTFKEISGAGMSKILFALPPLLEQHRIVAKVDELMGLCDQLEQQQTAQNELHETLVSTLLANLTDATGQREFEVAWQRISAHFDTLFTTEYSIDQLKQTILQLAVMGKLVPQDPNDEPANELIARFKEDRNKLLAEGKVQKAKFLQNIGKEDIPFKIPERWAWTRLSFIAEVIDPNPSHRMPIYTEIGIPFVSTENFGNDDKLDFDIGKKVAAETLNEQIKRFEIRPGAFALTRIGTIGKTIRLPLKRNYCLSHALCVISPFNSELNTKYLRLVVSADSIISQAHNETKSIGVPDLGMGSIRSFLIPMPPLAEQQRIVSKVDELFAICDKLKDRINQAQGTQNLLAEALVEKALVTKPEARANYSINEQNSMAAEP